ncbi:hypothetical protein C2G38_1571708 [Gigaspora rosea]|uniref:Uncharacterized protein n=1 Tax=Gigaspora rosea TaxID=44941 RepID=A0A397UZ98_9GLOM|nr:hypothetical protein C2G38_1571708 [Gigaspora rosea]
MLWLFWYTNTITYIRVYLQNNIERLENYRNPFQSRNSYQYHYFMSLGMVQ